MLVRLFGAWFPESNSHRGFERTQSGYSWSNSSPSHKKIMAAWVFSGVECITSSGNNMRCKLHLNAIINVDVLLFLMGYIYIFIYLRRDLWRSKDEKVRWLAKKWDWIAKQLCRSNNPTKNMSIWDKKNANNMQIMELEFAKWILMIKKEPHWNINLGLLT